MSQLRITKPPGSDDELDVEEMTLLAPWGTDQDFSIIGKPVPRVEGVEKVTGRARYAYDIRLPGQLYAKVLRCPLPHARLIRIDTSRAEALPGVHAVLSSANAPEISWYETSFLFDRTLHFAGEEIAAVAAESEEIAEDALRLIDVAYEPLPFVIDMETALQPDAPKVHPDGNLAAEPKTYQRGDIEAGFREADVIIDEVYTTHVALHNCFETHGCTAFWEGDQLTLWDSTQSVFDVRQQVAEKLKWPEHHVRVVKQYMGGGFGSKQIAWKHDVIAALLSRQASRPVQLMLDREAENLAVGNRNPTRQHLRIGATRDGRLTAISLKADQAAGAYSTGGEGSNTAGTFHTLYNCPNVSTEMRVIYINAGPAVAFRAPGHFEGAFALESAMDELARKLSIDPLELRRCNYTGWNQEEEKPYTSPDSLLRCYEQVESSFDWGNGHANGSGPKRRGVGFAAHDWMGGSGHPPGYAWVKLNSDGTVEVVTGTQDIGTGTRTGLTQVAAEELGLPMDSVVLHLGDTASGPYAPVSSGSATQATMGPAIRVAAADAKAQLLDAASKFVEAPVDQLSIRNGKIHVQGEPDDRAVPVAEVTGAIAPHMIMGQGARVPNPDDKAIRTGGAQAVEVEVDLETGEVTVLRVVTSHDCGRIVNPTMVDSQVVGGITQGIGFALTEDRVIDRRYGVVLNPNLEDYKIPTVADIPAIEHARVDLPDLEANLTGAKGIGEPPLIPTTPAIANAIFDAAGIRLRHSALTREHVLEALANHATGQKGASA